MKNTFVKNLATLAAMLGTATMASQAATLIDDYSGDLSNYTNTVILDANGGGSNISAWQISSGTLQFNTSSYNGIEQNAYIHNGLSLVVGQEVQVDVTLGSPVDRDLGLYVGNTIPTAGVRADYVNIYVRLLAGAEYGAVYSRGFNAAGSELSLVSGGAPTFDKLFIAYTATNTFELGYYDGTARSVVFTRTTANNAAGAVGFYSDARQVGTISGLDNLTVIPEPTAVLLGGLGLLGLLRRRRA